MMGSIGTGSFSYKTGVRQGSRIVPAELTRQSRMTPVSPSENLALTLSINLPQSSQGGNWRGTKPTPGWNTPQEVDCMAQCKVEGTERDEAYDRSELCAEGQQASVRTRVMTSKASCPVRSRFVARRSPLGLGSVH